MMYVSQIIMLYTLNLYSAVCQLYLNKTEKKYLWNVLRFSCFSTPGYPYIVTQ